MLEFTAEGTTGVVAAVRRRRRQGGTRKALLRAGCTRTTCWAVVPAAGGGRVAAVARPGFMLSAQSFQHSRPRGTGGRTCIRSTRGPPSSTTVPPVHRGPGEPVVGELRGHHHAVRYAAEAVGAWPDLRAEAFSGVHAGPAPGQRGAALRPGDVVDDAQDPATAQLRPYTEVMAAAIAHLDQAIAHTKQGASPSPPCGRPSRSRSDELRQLAYRSRRGSARTWPARPTSAAEVSWTQVIADAGNGITSDFSMVSTTRAGATRPATDMTEKFFPSCSTSTWGWPTSPESTRRGSTFPWPTGIPCCPAARPSPSITPDNRFPQGATIEAQRASPGRYYQAVPSPTWHAAGSRHPPLVVLRRPALPLLARQRPGAPFPSFAREELDLLRAEGHYRIGNFAQAADLVNATRVAAGLNATDAAGLNTSCVPRLPTGACGSLFEMLKWEYRLETQFQGTCTARPGTFWTAAGADLYRGTQLQLPVPCNVLRGRGRRATRLAAWAGTAPPRGARTSGRSSDRLIGPGTTQNSAPPRVSAWRGGVF